MTRKGIILLSILVITSLSVFAEDLTGSDIAERGQIIDLEGELIKIDEELFIKSNGVLYQLHMGPEFYSLEIGFNKENTKQAIVEGYIIGSDIAPIKIDIEHHSYKFRDINGRPMWSGRGNSRRNKSTNNNDC